MTERLLVQSEQTPENQAIQTEPLSYRERLGKALRRSGEGFLSLIDLTAGIAVAREQAQHTEVELRTLDDPYNGLLERQSSSDVVSMGLEDDILLTFRKDAQRHGFTDTDGMPDEQRMVIAEAAALAHRTEVSEELLIHHPEWDAEELTRATEVRLGDIAGLLGMHEAQRDAYWEAMLEYRAQQDSLTDSQIELAALQDERRMRLRKVGGMALRGIVSLKEKVRDFPNALAARATVAGMSAAERVRNWYGEQSPEGKTTVRQTAAGVALAGLAGFVAMRFGGYEWGSSGSGQSTAFELVSSESSLTPDKVGGAPDAVGIAGSPEQVGTTGGVVSVGETVRSVGQTPEAVGGGQPTPEAVGRQTPDAVGQQAPTSIGEVVTAPEWVGGDLSQAEHSRELFAGNERVNQWPTSVEVSRWNPNNLDGSLWGIGKQMWQRSGVEHPTDAQINQIVEVLRPQAQPNGFLLRGQTLDLRPAISILRKT